MRSLPWLLLSLFLAPVALRADGLFYQLPADGAWAKYDLELRTIANGEEKVMGKGMMTVSSVGRVEVMNEACRWIELKSEVTLERRGAKQTMQEVNKLLIPEKQLVRGGNPIGHVREAWKKQGDLAAVALDLEEDDKRQVASMDEFLSGPADSKPLEAAELDTSLGKLKCDGVRGTARGGTFETRLNSKAPFGVITHRNEKKRGATGRAMVFKLAAVGVNAKSEITNGK